MSDAWRYRDNLNDPETVKKLVQAVSTIIHAQTKVNPEAFADALDWNAVKREQHGALQAAGHPAGE